MLNNKEETMKQLLYLIKSRKKIKNLGIFSKIGKSTLVVFSKIRIFPDNKNQNISYLKKEFNYIKLMALVFGIFISQITFSQRWGGESNFETDNTWSISINGGLTSYYGDLSINDANFGEKLAKESGTAMGVTLNRHFNKIISISGQLLLGKLESNNSNVSFYSNLLEYNLHLRIDFLNLFTPADFNKFGITSYAGIGNFLFSTTSYELQDDIPKTTIHKTRVPEFVYFFGGGIYYKVTDKIGLSADLAIKQCQNDKLDNYVNGGDYDYYSYLSFGFTYYFNNFFKTPLKNKAKIAHSGTRLKSLNR